MDGLASLLDECTLPVKTTVARIGNMLWPGRSQGRVFPPFLMAGTRTYVLARPEIGVQALARQARPFTIHTGGLGLFTGGKPIIYISIFKDEPLMHFHSLLWEQWMGLRFGRSLSMRPGSGSHMSPRQTWIVSCNIWPSNPITGRSRSTTWLLLPNLKTACLKRLSLFGLYDDGYALSCQFLGLSGRTGGFQPSNN